MSEGAAKKEERRKFQAIKGTRDLLPPETALWSRVERIAQEVFTSYGFGEIRLPIFEAADLFARAVGGETDIVSKEMYTFEDQEPSETLWWRDLLGKRDLEGVRTVLVGKQPGFMDPDFFWAYEMVVTHFRELVRQGIEKGTIPATPENDCVVEDLGPILDSLAALRQQYAADQRQAYRDRFDLYVQQVRSSLAAAQLGHEVSLRPEATASICRAYIERNMQQWPQPVKLYTIGPMFRRERPQKGRYRQFYQIDAEVLGGSDAPGIDAELIEMVMTFFERLDLQGVQLELNSIGCRECRPEYVKKLREELLKVKDKLGADSQRRIETNPLRVLDSKLESEQKIIEGLPRISDHLCKDCAMHYTEVKKELAIRGVKYKENWRLVRGLDYYMRTTFEITAQGLGSQNAVCGGGRYDGLVELLGGPPTKGIGFAIGEDRLILSLQGSGKTPAAPGRDVYIAWMGEKAYATAIRAAKNLRNAGFSVELPPIEQKFGKALGQADKLGARYALILGDNEATSGEWTLKTLATGEQQKVREPQLLDFLKK